MSSSPFQKSQLVLIFCFSVLLLDLLMPTAATTDKNCIKTYKNFIRTACNSTRYPKDCYKALSSSASVVKTDPIKLCNIALSVTLNATYNASSLIDSLSKMKGLNPSEKQIISDCAETTSEAIDDLEKSLKALATLQSSDHKANRMSDLRTWVSAALTDEYTCADEFEDQKVSKAVKNTIKKSVLKLAKLTSNCLALFNLMES